MLERRPQARGLLLLFLLALLLRIGVIQQLRHLPTQQELVMDAARYDAWAREIAGGQWRPTEAFSQAPLYPYLLAAIYRATGGSAEAARFLQALAGAATAVLLAVAARRLFGDKAGWMAGILAAIYGPAVFYVPLLLKTTFHLFFEVAVLVLLLPPAGKNLDFRRVAAAGLCLGLAALLQENLLILLPVLLVGIAWRAAGSARHRGIAAGAFALGTALALAPFAAFNFAASGSLFLTSSQGGMNFYIGNAHGATGIYAALSSGSQDPAHQKADAQRIATALAGRPVAAAEVSAVFWLETARQIAAAPGDWLRLLGWKLRLLASAYEIPDAQGFDVYRREAGAWLLEPWGFGWLAPLALAGLVAAWRNGDPKIRRAAAGLALLAAVLALSIVAFFVFGRYRMVLVPFLVPLAGYAVARLDDLRRERNRRELAAIAGVALSLGILVNLPSFNREDQAQLEAAIHYNLGLAANRGSIAAFHRAETIARAAGPREEAKAELDRAVDLGHEAERHLRQALVATPDFFNARLETSWVLFRRGGFLAAAGRFREAAAVYARARTEVTAALASGGDAPPKAQAEARRLAGAIAAGEQAARVRI